MTIDAFDPHPAIRNPAASEVRWRARAEVAHESAAALYLEGIFLGCVLIGVASVLPVVMLMRG